MLSKMSTNVGNQWTSLIPPLCMCYKGIHFKTAQLSLYCIKFTDPLLAFVCNPRCSLPPRNTFGSLT